MKKSEPPKFKNGDIIYTKTFQKSLRGSMPHQFQGMAVCMLLGHVPTHGIDLSPHQVMRTLGTNGFILMDDIAEFLGEEQTEICIKKFEEKYWPKAAQVTEASEPEESKQPEEIPMPNAAKKIILTDRPDNGSAN